MSEQWIERLQQIPRVPAGVERTAVVLRRIARAHDTWQHVSISELATAAKCDPDTLGRHLRKMAGWGWIKYRFVQQLPPAGTAVEVYFESLFLWQPDQLPPPPRNNWGGNRQGKRNE